MGTWNNNEWLYDAKDIRQILDYGRTDEARKTSDAIEEQADVNRAMKELKIKRGFKWVEESYQKIADFLNTGGYK